MDQPEDPQGRYRDQIARSSFVANPGCYVTASLLALIPLGSLGQSGCWSKRKIGPAGPNGRFCQPGMGGRSLPGESNIPNARDQIDTCPGVIRSLNWIGA